MPKGRPKGSKNKLKNLKEGVPNSLPIVKRGRGRPKGAKGKPKEIKEISLEVKRIKKEIKDLKAEKLRLPSGSKERIELHRKIKEMKSLLIEKKEIKTNTISDIIETNMEKEPIIAEILGIEAKYKIKPRFEDIGIDLHKYTLEQLNFHLERIKKNNTLVE